MGLSAEDKVILDWVTPRLAESIQPADLLIELCSVITSDVDRTQIFHKAESEGPKVGMFHLLQKYELIANDLTALEKALQELGHNLFIMIEERGNNEQLRDAIEKTVEAKRYMFDRAQIIDSKDQRANWFISWWKGNRKRTHSVSTSQKSVPLNRKSSVRSVSTVPSHYLGSFPSVSSLSDYAPEPTSPATENCETISTFVADFENKFGHLMYMFNKKIAHQQIQSEVDMDKLKSQLEVEFDAMAKMILEENRQHRELIEELKNKLLLQMQRQEEDRVADSNENRNRLEMEMENIVRTFQEGNITNREKIEEINKRITMSFGEVQVQTQLDNEISDISEPFGSQKDRLLDNEIPIFQIPSPLRKDESQQTACDCQDIEIQTDNSSQDRQIQCDMQLNPSIALVAGLIGLLVLFAVLVNPATNLMLISIPSTTHQNLGLDVPQTPITPCSELQSNFTSIFGAVVHFVERTVQLQNRMSWDFEDVSCSSLPIAAPISGNIELLRETFISVIDFEKCIQYRLENCARERKLCQKAGKELGEINSENKIVWIEKYPWLHFSCSKASVPIVFPISGDIEVLQETFTSVIDLQYRLEHCARERKRCLKVGKEPGEINMENKIAWIEKYPWLHFIIRLGCCLVGISAFGLFFYFILYQEGLREALVYGLMNILVSISFSGLCLMYNYIFEWFVS